MFPIDLPSFQSYFLGIYIVWKIGQGPIQVIAAYNANQTWVNYRNLINIMLMRQIKVIMSSLMHTSSDEQKSLSLVYLQWTFPSLLLICDVLNYLFFPSQKRIIIYQIEMDLLPFLSTVILYLVIKNTSGSIWALVPQHCHLIWHK